MVLIIIIIFIIIIYHFHYHHHRHLLLHHYGIINAPQFVSSVFNSSSVLRASPTQKFNSLDSVFIYMSVTARPTDEKSLSDCAELALRHSSLRAVADMTG